MFVLIWEQREAVTTKGHEVAGGYENVPYLDCVGGHMMYESVTI